MIMRIVGRWAYSAARLITWLLATFYWRITITGRQHVPESGPFILAGNHRSNIDGPLTCILTRRRMRYLAKSEMFKIEKVGRLYKAMGAISVNRGAPDRASLAACLKVLTNDEQGLVLFPEGTRQTGAEISDIHDGALYLALRSGAPVVPVGFGHTAGAHKKGKLYLSPVKVNAVIGEPMYLSRGDDKRVTREAIADAKIQLQQRLQALFDESEGR